MTLVSLQDVTKSVLLADESQLEILSGVDLAVSEGDDLAILVAVLRSELVVSNIFAGMQDVPPFPMRAALTGFAAAVAVGAISGFIPALVALRVKTIDAIRF